MVNETIRIYCRIKPLLTKKQQASQAPYELKHRDETDEDVLTLAVPKDQSEGLVNNKKEQYTSKFRRIFDQDVYQDEVFDTIAKPVVDKVLEGFNGTVFAYGQTGSGKTYTVTGGAEKFSDRGLIPRTLSYIFERRKSLMADVDLGVAVSYLEIYNEAGFDLLDPKHDISKLEDLPRVSIMEDTDGNIHLRNLSMQPAQSEEEALNLLFLGDTNRMIAETPMNQASTRSHCIFTIHVSMRRSGSDAVRRSKMHLVDLAGSERVSKTGVSGVLLTEAKYINLSLHHLEQVIIALSEPGRTHVPYRNCLMTSVLRDSLGGNCITAMIATCSVDKNNVLESISTCRFAQRVAQVKNDAHVNEETDPSAVISRLKREVQTLRDQLALSGSSDGAVGPLTLDEQERCQNLIKQYIMNDLSLEDTLPIKADMRLIQYCFQLLKREIKTHQCAPALPPPPPELPPQRLVLSDLDLAALTDPTGHLPPEVVKLKQIVQQRDNEISVLMNMLKRERERTKTILGNNTGGGNSENDATFVNRSQQVTQSQSMPSQYHQASAAGMLTSSSASSSTLYLMNSSSNNLTTMSASSSANNKNVSASSLKDDPAKQAAFEQFIKQHPTRHVFESQREELKRKYAEAKAAGDSLSSTKDRVSSYKAELDKVRAQIAVSAAIGSSGQAVDQVLVERESRLRETLEHERITYRDAVERLKQLRSEIEHLHHLHTANRTKLLKQFDEQVYLAQTGVTASYDDYQRRQSPPTISSSTSSSKNFEAPPPQQQVSSTNIRQATFSIPSKTAPPPPSPHQQQQQQQQVAYASNIPLTGDGEVDENIQAFLRARQALMQRAAANAGRPTNE